MKTGNIVNILGMEYQVIKIKQCNECSLFNTYICQQNNTFEHTLSCGVKYGLGFKPYISQSNNETTYNK